MDITQSRGRSIGHIGLICALTLLPRTAAAQLKTRDIEALRARGQAEGWTFFVTENEATAYPLSALCGAVVPPDALAPAPAPKPNAAAADSLPGAWDWRQHNGLTPVKNQGGCGSCWAFAAVGSAEAVIRLNLGVTVNLSEQWLVSCTDAGNCGGGWHDSALRYMMCTGREDSCGAHGAVLESAFPYQASNVACGCPYDRPYCLKSYSAVNGSVDAIKAAIYHHGPVSTTVYVNSAFQGYGGGVFNACEDQSLNHAVVLVGWDDSQNCWIMRNSWGTGWGESGYMRITYGCSRIGEYTYYTEYALPAPTDVVASDTPPTDRVHVSWTSCPGATSYEVWRGTSGNVTAASMLGEATTNSYDDFDNASCATYYYWVRARNQIAVSDFSEPDTGLAWPILGDFDRDGDVDQSDFGHLQACLNGSVAASPECQDARLDSDNDVDQSDANVFRQRMTGSHSG